MPASPKASPLRNGQTTKTKNRNARTSRFFEMPFQGGAGLARIAASFFSRNGARGCWIPRIRWVRCADCAPVPPRRAQKSPSARMAEPVCPLGQNRPEKIEGSGIQKDDDFKNASKSAILSAKSSAEGQPHQP